MLETGQDPELIVQEKNLLQVSDEGEIMKVIEEILKEHPNQVDELRAGKEKLMGFFVGQLMKRMKGKANPAMANELFKKAIRSNQ